MQNSNERLDAAIAGIHAELGRTDAKAGALLAALAIPFAVLTATLPGRSLSTPTTVLALLGTLGLGAAMGTVLWTIRPGLRTAARGTFLYWADCTADQVLADMASDSRAEVVPVLSRLARRKYRALSRAFAVTTVSFGVLVIAVLVALVAG